MNPNKSGSNYTFDFDLGINSNKSNKPLNAQQKNNMTSSWQQQQTTSSWQQPSNKPSWTHQPAAPMTSSSTSLNGPTSMVGDITGRSWNSSSGSGNGIGIANIASKNTNLFSDLLGGSNIANKISTCNVPLKNVGSSQTGVKSAYSMSGMAGSLPKTGNGSYNTSASGYGNYNTSKSQNLGGSSMKSGGIGGSGNKDPFGGLVDFSAKGSGGMKTGNKTNVGSKTSVPVASGGDAFGSFQNAAKSQSTFDDFGFGGMGSQTPVQSSSMGSGIGSQSKFDDFGFGAMPSQPPVQSSSMGSGVGSQSKLDDFGFGGMPSQAPVQSSGGNDFDVLFSSSSASAGNNANEQFAGAEDWGFESETGGGGDVGGTTELEGLPPPPAGVTSSSAKSKGMDNYKAGQYPDAIKWLSWAVILLEKGGDKSGAREVLSSRASCYKEVGEYKKAVADCSKVLEQDAKNVSVLVQRALLYESMEKYKLGAEDLRTVMNIDPGNRVARSTIHRLTKMAS